MQMDTQAMILKMAARRFADYGYCKTTMAEIAADGDMSVGNLYRHFTCKEALAVACVSGQIAAKLEAGLAAARKETDALGALHSFLRVRLRIGHDHFANTRHLFDMMAMINNRHRDLLLRHEERVIQAIAGMLEQGVAQGQFACADPRQMAYDIHQATLRYNNPVNLKYNDLSLLEADLQRLVTLLYRGLRC